MTAQDSGVPGTHLLRGFQYLRFFVHPLVPEDGHHYDLPPRQRSVSRAVTYMAAVIMEWYTKSCFPFCANDIRIALLYPTNICIFHAADALRDRRYSPPRAVSGYRTTWVNG